MHTSYLVSYLLDSFSLSGRNKRTFNINVHIKLTPIHIFTELSLSNIQILPLTSPYVERDIIERKG